MTISIAEARQLMGKTNEKYSDSQLEEMINVLDFMADLAIDTFLRKRNKKKEVKKYEKTTQI